MLKVLSCVVLALTMSACATNPDNSRRDRLGVQVATMALIERASNPAEKADQIIHAVEEARVLLELESVAVSDLRGAMLARVAERFASGKLTPLERLAALEVVNSVSDEVERRLGAGLLTPDSRVRVNTVLSWVDAAARTYVPHAS